MCSSTRRRGARARARNVLVNPDRVEALVTQVLEETRAFRQETIAFRQETMDRFERIDRRFERVDRRFDGIDRRFDGVDQRFEGVDQKIDGLRRDVTLVQTAVLDVARDVKRLETKLDPKIAEHGARLDKLEGSAAQ